MNSINDKYIKAGNPETSPEDLRLLASDDLDNVRRRVAENPQTPCEVLWGLATDENPDVRIAVAENPATPPELTSKLAQDPALDVRYSIAENANVSEEVLWILSEDEHPYVSHRAIQTLRRFQTPSISPLKPRIDHTPRDINWQ